MHPSQLQNDNQLYDFIIVGGGMAGATAAIALAQLGLSIALIEAVKPELDISPSFDQRAVALSASSVAIYQSLGIWPLLKNIGCPIKHISVSDQGNFGFSRLAAKDYGIEALGQVIPLDLTGPILWQIIYAQSNIDVFCPAKVISVKTTLSKESKANISHVVIHPESLQPEKIQEASTETNSITLSCKLLLVADGTYSTIAEQLNIEYSRKSYQQHALITNIVTELPHQHRAYERFTRSGPLALLPLADIQPTNITQTSSSKAEINGNCMSLVWCFKPEELDSILNATDEIFIEQLQKSFGYRLGRIIKVGQRTTYPLSLHIAEKSFLPGVLLLGNAAHTLHPIAGQGFNLGLRDIACFVEQVELSLKNNSDLGSTEFLSQFVNSRHQDWQQTIFATDSLVRLFSNQFLPFVFCRNQAMKLINQIPFLKKQIALSAMGFKTRSSRLARGFKLNQSNIKPSQPKETQP